MFLKLKCQLINNWLHVAYEYDKRDKFLKHIAVFLRTISSTLLRLQKSIAKLFAWGCWFVTYQLVSPYCIYLSSFLQLHNQTRFALDSSHLVFAEYLHSYGETLESKEKTWYITKVVTVWKNPQALKFICKRIL